MIICNYGLCQKANSVKLNLSNFGYARVDSNWNGYVKDSAFSRLYYVIDGEAYIEYDNIQLTLLPGNWYLIPSDFSFNFWCDDEMEHLFFHISISGIDGIDLLSKFTTPVSMEDDTYPHTVYMDYLQNDSLFAALSVKEKVYNTVFKFMQKSSINPEITELSQCVQKAVEFINDNLCKKLDLVTIAEYSYVSKSTLTNKFKNELKITVQEYVHRQKMLMASQMLKNSNMSVAEISDKLGFSEQFYFSKCFKQKFGLTPREYRKSKIN